VVPLQLPLFARQAMPSAEFRGHLPQISPQPVAPLNHILSPDNKIKFKCTSKPRRQEEQNDLWNEFVVAQLQCVE